MAPKNYGLSKLLCLIFCLSSNQLIISQWYQCPIVALTALWFIVAWVAGYLSLWCVLIDAEESPSNVPMYRDIHTHMYFRLGSESRPSIPCSAVMYFQYMTNHPFVLNLQVYSCAASAKKQESYIPLPLLLHGPVWLRVLSVCCYTHKQTHSLPLWLKFIFVFMQREERHWSNKSCSYLHS